MTLDGFLFGRAFWAQRSLKADRAIFHFPAPRMQSSGCPCLLKWASIQVDLYISISTGILFPQSPLVWMALQMLSVRPPLSVLLRRLFERELFPFSHLSRSLLHPANLHSALLQHKALEKSEKKRKLQHTRVSKMKKTETNQLDTQISAKMEKKKKTEWESVAKTCELSEK